MKHHKIIAALTAAACAAPCLFMQMLPAAAETEGTYEHLTYTAYDDHVVITGFDNKATDVVIPEFIELLPVTEIGAEAFKDATRLKTVTLPDTLVIIGTSAFYNDTALTAIEFPEGLLEIRDTALNRCTSITEVTLPENLEILGWGAFYGCASLQKADIHGTMVTFNESVFQDCISLSSVYIPLGVTNMNCGHNNGLDYKNVFYNCPIVDVYYEGSEVQWSIISNRGSLDKAAVHYGSPNPPRRLTPDLNGDGTVNAQDAAIVLEYAAYVGANGKIDMLEYLEMTGQ